MVVPWSRYAEWLLFLLLPLLYTWLYGTVGVNESDGGFLTGLAWQVHCGKVLYADVVYVRPPLPVWWRAMELALLPEDWAVLGERIVFYFKVAAYCGLGAAVLMPAHPERWVVFSLAFALSAHNYPPMAWHTTDGLLWGALAFWVLFRWPKFWGSMLAGALLAASMLCKQSFYPLAVLGIGVGIWAHSLRHGLGVAAGVALGWGGFATYLWANGLWESFWSMTTGATSLAQAWQHGVLDYVRIRPSLAAFSAPLLLGVWWFGFKGSRPMWALGTWAMWLALLGAVYLWDVEQRREFTLPFAQVRLLFWISHAYALGQWWRGEWPKQQLVRYAALAALSWCAAVSWGYNLPILFSIPWAYVLWEISQRLSASPGLRASWLGYAGVALVFLLFWHAHRWVYRDGERSAMSAPLGEIFPALSGIRSSPQKVALYANLKALAEKYGPHIAVLPAFPQANFLTRTCPPLPLDWVVAREMGRSTAFVEREALRKKPFLLLEKTAIPALNADPELAVVRRLCQQGQLVEETPFFQVFRLP